MDPARLLAPLCQALETFSKEWGLVSLASDPFNVYEILTTGPNGVLIVVAWDGDEHAGSVPQSPFVNHQVDIFVARNRQPLSEEPNAQLVYVDPYDGERPLFEIVSAVRDFARAFRFENLPGVAPKSHQPSFYYAGTFPVILPQDLPLAAYRIRFSLNASLPPLGAQSPVAPK